MCKHNISYYYDKDDDEKSREDLYKTSIHYHLPSFFLVVSHFFSTENFLLSFSMYVMQSMDCFIQ